MLQLSHRTTWHNAAGAGCHPLEAHHLATRPLIAGAAARGLPLRRASCCRAEGRGSGGATAGPELDACSNPFEQRKNIWDCNNEISRLGMWDGVPEGPSCVFLREPLSAEEPARVEELYMQARDTYFAGVPLVADEYFDRLEMHLKLMGSDVVHKWPRCSLQRKKTYGDVRVDKSLLSSLAGVWVVILAVGLAPVLFCLAKHLSVAAALVPTARSFIPAVSGLSLLVAAVAVRSLAKVRDGETIALKGDCPNCGDEVYAFIQLAKLSGSADEEVQQPCSCHVCSRPLVFHARICAAGPAGSGMRQVASGRVYLISTQSDFFPHDAAGAGAAGGK